MLPGEGSTKSSYLQLDAPRFLLKPVQFELAVIKHKTQLEYQIMFCFVPPPQVSLSFKLGVGGGVRDETDKLASQICPQRSENQQKQTK